MSESPSCFSDRLVIAPRTSTQRAGRWVAGASAARWLRGMVIALALIAGCKQQVSERSPAASRSSQRSQLDHLGLLDRMLRGEHRMDSELYGREAVRLLNQWRESADSSVTWSRDPMLEQWTGALGERVELDLGNDEFLEADARYLRQQVWAGALASWLPRRQRVADYRLLLDSTLVGLAEDQLAILRTSSTPLADLLRIRYPDLTQDQSRDLASAWVAFDWTIRNVQLDELRDWPGDNELSILSLVDGDRSLPVSMGVPGPGYSQYVDGVIAHGHGDGWQRGRVFLAIAGAMQLEGAWLAIRSDDRASLGMATPWVVAIRIGQEAFLFDPQLGLPLPTKNRDGIATWSQVKQDPSLLRQLEVADFERAGNSSRPLPYRVTEEDLSRVVVLLDINPSALSERMALLEQSLTGSARVAIRRFPTDEAQRWKELDGIAEVGLWDVPAMVPIYRRIYEAAVRNRNERVMADYLFKEQSLEIGGLQVGRHLTLLGRFENAEQFTGEASAKETLQTMRYTDAFIESLKTDDKLRRQFGVDTDGALSVEERDSMTSILQRQLKSVRVVAVLWMGLVHYELGDAGSARQWLSQVEEFDWMNSWGETARYNMARSLELQRRDEEAAKMYQAIGGPQEAGNSLRARWLFDRVRAMGAPSSSNEPPAETASPTTSESSAPAADSPDDQSPND